MIVVCLCIRTNFTLSCMCVFVSKKNKNKIYNVYFMIITLYN